MSTTTQIKTNEGQHVPDNAREYSTASSDSKYLQMTRRCKCWVVIWFREINKATRVKLTFFAKPYYTLLKCRPSFPSSMWGIRRSSIDCNQNEKERCREKNRKVNTSRQTPFQKGNARKNAIHLNVMLKQNPWILLREISPMIDSHSTIAIPLPTIALTTCSYSTIAIPLPAIAPTYSSHAISPTIGSYSVTAI